MAITPKEKELAAVGADAPAQSNYPHNPRSGYGTQA